MSSVSSLLGPCPVPVVSVHELANRCGFATPLDYPESSLRKPLIEWRMEIDDSPVFRYVYRNHRPQRHLEFGTWQGTGTLYCLEECQATVWTINLPDGELQADGSWTYCGKFDNPEALPTWTTNSGENHKYYQTDSGGFIGRYYRERNLGHRVCQIYSDSRAWDTSNYPADFFDSVLIDGGHTEEIVVSDTQKAYELTRPGAIVMWHDFCPDETVLQSCPSTHGTMSLVKSHREWLDARFTDLFWIEPTWIMLGIRA